jgi:hypothetical protein
MAERKRPSGARDGSRTSATRAKKSSKAAPKAPSKSATKPTAKAPATGPIVEQLGPRLRAEFEELTKSEAKILRGLAAKGTAEEFVRDPAAALRRMKVDVPPTIAARLKNPELLGDIIAPRSYQLPNGQVVTPRVTVRFTAGRRA